MNREERLIRPLSTLLVHQYSEYCTQSWSHPLKKLSSGTGTEDGNEDSLKCLFFAWWCWKPSPQEGDVHGISTKGSQVCKGLGEEGLDRDWPGHFHQKNWEALSEAMGDWFKTEKGLTLPKACGRSVEFVATGVADTEGLDRYKERLDKHLKEQSTEGY